MAALAQLALSDGSQTLSELDFNLNALLSGATYTEPESRALAVDLSVDVGLWSGIAAFAAAPAVSSGSAYEMMNSGCYDFGSTQYSSVAGSSEYEGIFTGDSADFSMDTTPTTPNELDLFLASLLESDLGSSRSDGPNTASFASEPLPTPTLDASCHGSSGKTSVRGPNKRKADASLDEEDKKKNAKPNAPVRKSKAKIDKQVQPEKDAVDEVATVKSSRAQYTPAEAKERRKVQEARRQAENRASAKTNARALTLAHSRIEELEVELAKKNSEAVAMEARLKMYERV